MEIVCASKKKRKKKRGVNRGYFRFLSTCVSVSGFLGRGEAFQKKKKKKAIDRLVTPFVDKRKSR